MSKVILGRGQILSLVKENGLIEGFSPDCLGGAGYDLRVDKVYEIKGCGFLGSEDRRNPPVEEKEFTTYSLKPQKYILIETLEKVSMPNNLAARILPRSTLFRCGCMLTTALVDPGYKGALVMGLQNVSCFDFLLERRARIAQIIFESIEGETKPYEGRYQGGKIV